MDVWIKVLVLACLASASFGQAQVYDLKFPVHITELVIESGSNSLSKADRQQITRSFRGKTYSRDEINNQLRQTLRNRGYLSPLVDGPWVMFQTEGSNAAKVVVGLNAGVRTVPAKVMTGHR
jgi:hypothetical protein